MERPAGLIGRRSERDRLAALLDGVVEGRGGALCVVGPPGAGKSRLLAALEERSRGHVDVRRAAPVQAEHPLAFAALADLVAPLLAAGRGLGDAERAALHRAIDGTGAEEPGALTILRAVVGLLDHAARDRPQLVLVDDAHALDLASLPAIGFLARRAGLRPVGVVLATRPEGDALAELEGIPRLVLGDLAPAEARELLVTRGCGPAVARAVAAELGGNPLALTEGSDALTPAERDGRAPLPDPLPVGARLEQTYGRRFAALPEDTRRALLVTACATTSAAGPIGTAAGPGPLDEVLAPAEDAGLVTLAPGHVRFVHPLMRQGVLRFAAPADRRRAHAALADAVPDRARAWHRAAAVTRPDAAVADALDELAADARSRGAPGVAARALERAADLSVDDADRGRRTLAAAVAAGHASRPAWALRLVDGLLEETDDPALRAQAVEQRGTALLQEGRPREAASVFEAEARRAQDDEPFRAALLLIRAGAALLASGSVARLADLARDAAALLPPDAQAVPGIMEALALTSTGRHDRARELLRAAKPVLEALDPCGEGHEILSITGFGLTWLEELDDADALLWRCITAAREAGAVGPLALPLATRGPLDLRLGAWDRALEHAEEVIGLADATDSGFAVALACATAAWVHAVRGEEELARGYAERSAAVGARHDLGQVDAYSSSALGLLHLSAGRPADAATHLEASHRRSANQGTTDPGFVATGPDLVEALLADGRADRAARVAALVEVAARDGGGPWALAGAARCRLLLAPDDGLDRTADEALRTAELLPSPFDTARTRLVVGERLRRARRRSDARGPLAQAADAFAGMRAVPWERRARAELDACGGRAPVPGTEELTARERDVCVLVVEGRSNREVAAALHLSPRTVEHHLRHAFRKLGVRSRTALAARWRDGD